MALKKGDLFLVNREEPGGVWKSYKVAAEEVGGNIESSPIAPTDPVDGDLWFNSSNGITYIYYENPSTTDGQWVDVRPGGGGGSSVGTPINPDPGDLEITPTPPGGGTAGDPYILTPITVDTKGGSGQSVEQIVIKNQDAGDYVVWTDNSTGAGDRFAQPTGIIAPDGTWTGRVVYNDVPESSSNATYTGELKLGSTSVYFKWVVTQQLSPASIDKPTIIAPGPNAGIGGAETYTPKTSEVTAVTDITGGGGTATTPEQNPWYSVTYGGGRYVGVAQSGTSMVSTNGTSWSTGNIRDGNWASVTYGIYNGKSRYVAVSPQGPYNNVNHSDDGLYWTSAKSPENYQWYGVTYGNGKFVAVAASGASNYPVMDSTDGGVTWTHRVVPNYTNAWNSITFGNNKFVAVASGGDDKRVMYSADGTNWYLSNSTPTNQWNSVTYGEPNGVPTFVAVANSGINRVMYSNDAITWTPVPAAEEGDHHWESVTYGNGKFVAVASNGEKRVMYSSDGISWTATTAAAQNKWWSVTYGNMFVAVSSDGDDRVMYSYDGAVWKDYAELTLQNGNTFNADTGDDMGQPISETFLAGQTVTGKKAGEPDALGKLTEDAVGNTITVAINVGDLGYSESPEQFTGDPTIISDGTYFYSWDNGSHKYVLRSTDGREWEEFAVPEPISKKTGGAATAGSLVLAPNKTTSASPTNVFVSTNQGQSFSTIPTGLTGGIKAVVAGEDGNYLALGTTSGEVAISTNHGQGWSIGTSTGTSCDFGVWTGTKWVLYGGGNVYSGNATSAWTVDSSTFMMEGLRVMTSDYNGTLLAANTTGYYYSTNDGAAWSAKLTIPGKAYYHYGVAYGGGKWSIVDSTVHATDNLTDPTAGWKKYADLPVAAESVAINPSGLMIAAYNTSGLKAQYNIVGISESPFVTGMEVISDTPVTKSAPGATTLEFVGSQPSGSGVTTWGKATWEVTDLDNGGTMTDTKGIPTPASTTQTLSPGDRFNIVLEADTTYKVRLKYDSSDPNGVESLYSDDVNFKTSKVGAGGPPGWNVVDVPDNNWTGISYGTAEDGTPFYVATSANNKFGTIAYSEDLENWFKAKVDGGDISQCQQVTYGIADDGKGYWVANTYTNSDTIHVAYTTDPRNTWQTATCAPGATKTFRAMEYIDGTFINFEASGPRAYLATNPVGPWTETTTLNGNCYRAVAYDGTVLAVGNTNQQVTYAPTNNLGANWTPSSAIIGQVNSVSVDDDGNFAITRNASVSTTSQSVFSGNFSDFDTINPVDIANSIDFKARSIAYGAGKFVVVSSNTSKVFTLVATDAAGPYEYNEVPIAGDWRSIQFINNRFVVIGIGDKLMWSWTGTSENAARYYDSTANKMLTGDNISSKYGVDSETADLSQLGIRELTEQPSYPVAAFVPAEGDKYQPIEDLTPKVQALTVENASAEVRIVELEEQVETAQTTVETLRADFEARIAALEAE